MTDTAKDLENDVKASIILMGSFQFSILANDIDLILVYEISDYVAIKKLKKFIADALYDIFSLPVHFTTLSKNEYSEMKQIQLEEHLIIFDDKLPLI